MEIDLVVVGPEAPLVAGIVDDLAAIGVACFGPTRAAAKLEGSKGFAKDFCREFRIPTGEYCRFADRSTAKAYAQKGDNAKATGELREALKHSPEHNEQQEIQDMLAKLGSGR